LSPEVVPLNFLNPRPGTPLSGAQPLTPLEAVKYIAVYRLGLPDAVIKLAGGREGGLRSLQGLALLAGADGIVIGGYLTTAGRPPAEDLQLLADTGWGARARP
ncbi:MAG: biotin synthase BioB, partial [bacterium]